jgi:hypothetical protein
MKYLTSFFTDGVLAENDGIVQTLFAHCLHFLLLSLNQASRPKTEVVGLRAQPGPAAARAPVREPSPGLSEPATAGKAASIIRVTGADSLSLALTTATGIVAGSFKTSATSPASPVNAIVYQNGLAPSIIGNFMEEQRAGTNEGGAVTLTSP